MLLSGRWRTLGFVALLALLLVPASHAALPGGALGNAQSEGPLWETDEPDESDAERPPRQWTLIYYIAHDNNLGELGSPSAHGDEGQPRSPHEQQVLDLLPERAPSADVAAVAFADKPQWQRMRRIRITEQGRSVAPITSSNSADPATLRACLEWVATHEPAQRYAVVLLGHGGRLGELCVDMHPDGGGDKKPSPAWMPLEAAQRELREWRREVEGEKCLPRRATTSSGASSPPTPSADGDTSAAASVELLFLQLCGAGTLATLHSLRETARYLMASQTAVLAPNHYYAPLMRTLARTPEVDGRRLAHWIARYDEPKMFANYVSVDSAALERLPAKLDRALAPLLSRAQRQGRLHAPGEGEGNERYELTVRHATPTRMIVPIPDDGVWRLHLEASFPLTMSLSSRDGQTVHATATGRDTTVEAKLAAGRYLVTLGPSKDAAHPPPRTVHATFHVQHGRLPRATHVVAANEAAYDVMQWLHALYRANALEAASLEPFAAYLDERLLVAHHRSSSRGHLAAEWCGLSLTVPGDHCARERLFATELSKHTELRRLFAYLVPEED